MMPVVVTGESCESWNYRILTDGSTELSINPYFLTLRRISVPGLPMIDLLILKAQVSDIQYSYKFCIYEPVLVQRRF